MNHIEDGLLKDRYLRIIQAAWEAVFGVNPVRVDQGASLEDMRGVFDAWKQAARCLIARSGNMRFSLRPSRRSRRSHKTRGMEPGMYLIVDMGAGTTDISINHVVNNNITSDKLSVNCYFDRSIRLGGDDFDGLPGRADRDRVGTALLKRFQSASMIHGTRDPKRMRPRR